MAEPRGYTLIETLLALAILAILAALALPVFRGLQIRTDQDTATSIITSSLHRAQVRAQGVEGDSTWGVRISVGSVTLFKGTSYATRDTTYDETTSIGGSLNPSGTLEYVFQKSTGRPVQSGTITLTDYTESTTLTISPYGTVTY